MSAKPFPRSARASRGSTASDPSLAALFTLVWEALADVLGTAATATLLRRAARAAVRRCTELNELAISRENLEYRYTLPAGWRNGGQPDALRELVAELRPLLVELTGPVVYRRLERIPALRERGIIPPEKEAQS